MKAIDFYKFITENEIEYHWHEHDGKQDVIFFVEYRNIEDFAKILTTFDFDEDGVECHMKDGYFCFWADDILAGHGIELEEIFKKEFKQEVTR